MKAAEPKTASVAPTQKANQPFFSKEAEGNFFGESVNKEPSFFKPSPAYSVNGNGVLQTKLTIGEPNDKYEQEADAMADKVVQRLATPDVITKKEASVQTKPIATSITPFVQTKCTSCEQEDKLQKKDEEDLVQESPLELQRKHIFESNVEPPDDNSLSAGMDRGQVVQRKCAACEQEDKLQKKEEEDLIQESPLELQSKPIFESNAEPPDDENTVQRKCEVCASKESLNGRSTTSSVESLKLENARRSIDNLEKKKFPCPPVSDSYANMGLKGEGTIGLTSIDKSSDLLCVPQFDIDTKTGQGTLKKLKVSLKMNSKFSKQETEAPLGLKLEIPGCKTEVPVFVNITKDVSDLAQIGEQEHCDDVNLAFKQTLVPCSKELNKFVGQKFPGKNFDECYKSLVAKIGFDPINCSEEFVNFSNKTEERDIQGFHDFDFKPISKDCKKVVVEFKKAKTNKVGDKSVAPDKWIPASAKCAKAKPAATPSGSSTPTLTPTPAPKLKSKTLLQKKCGECENEEKLQTKPGSSDSATASSSISIESSLNSSKGSGSPIPEDTREQMESSFGADLSNVRLHTDNSAVQMNKNLHAQAFTHGSDIYFNSGKYDTNSIGGKHLLAHELTHVVQQGATTPGNIRRQPDAKTQPPVDKSFYEFIPTTTLNITLGNVYFMLSPDATFQPGPKVPQILMIFLKKLIGDQYKPELLKPLEQFLFSDKDIKRIGHLQGKKNAYTGELIGNLFISIPAFVKLTAYLDKQGLKGQLTDEEKDKIQLGIHEAELWISIINGFRENGYPVPKWFDKHFFDSLMLMHISDLKEYDALLRRYTKEQTAELQKAGNDKFNVILDLVSTDVALLENVRRNISLLINPITQVAYKTIWQIDNNKDLSKPPVAIQSLTTALALIEFARKNPEQAKAAETDDAAMVRLIELFLRDYKIPEEEMKILPPFPSFIVAPDLNPDNTTVTTAKNNFRMITQFEEIYGSNLLHGATVAMQMTMYHSWSVFKMPESLQKLKLQGTSPTDMVTLSNEFVKNSPQNLGQPVDTYPAKESRERKISMSGLSTGDFVLMSVAAPRYTKKMNRVQKPSTAGYTFSVYNAADLAKTSAYADWDMLTKLKNELATADPDRKKEIQNEINSIEKRESTDLLTLTRQDIADTDKILGLVNKLKIFIEDDRKENKAYYGNKTTDPFNIRLRKYDLAAYDLYMMVRQTFPVGKYSDREAVDKYIELLTKQKKDLGDLKERSRDAYLSFKPGSPTYRVVAGLVKEDDGNLVPLIMVAGYHPDADPEKGNYKIKLVDVTFDSPKKGDMIYVGDEVQSDVKNTGERDAVASAFKKFAGNHKYGKGYIVYRLPGTDYSGGVNSYTTLRTYLGYAIAALGLVLLVAGVIASAGALTPAAAAVVSALGVAVGVAGAVLSIQNIKERKEKGVLEWDTDTALDIINIIAGVVLAVGAVIKITQVVSKSVSLLLAIERAKGLYMVYDAVNIAANAYLIHEKVKEDVAAIKKMKLPKHEEDELLSQVAFDAIQQGAMLAVSAYSLARGANEHFKSKVNGTSYHSWQEKGWITEVNGKLNITAEAPPFLRAKMSLFGTAPPTEESTTTGKGPGQQGDKPPTTEEQKPPTEQTTTTGTGDKPPVVGEVPVAKPLTFEERITGLWQSRLKTKPPMLDTCVKKMRTLKMSEENILNLVNNGTNHEKPNQFFGDLNVFLIHGEKRTGAAGFNKIIEGLSSPYNFESASLLMQNAASSSKANVKSIVDNLTMDDITAFRNRMPPQENAETVNSLRRIADHVDGTREEVLALMDKAGQGEKGLEKFNRAIDRLGEGRFKPERISDSIDLGVKIEKAISEGGDAMAKIVWGEEAAKAAAAKKNQQNEKPPLEVTSKHTDEKPGDRAYAHVKGHMKEIVENVLAPGGKEIDPVKWGVARDSIANTDLPDIIKNQIIGEMWAASKIKAYENQGFDAVIREVTIDIYDTKGNKIGEVHLDAVLVKGNEVQYKEFKSSEKADTTGGQKKPYETTDTSTDQKKAYKLLEEGKINQLRPRGENAKKAFGGPKFPRFVAKPVDFDRPQ